MIEETGPPLAPTSGEPETQPSTPQAPAQPVTPDELAVLKARLEEKDNFIGKQTNIVGDLRNEVGYLRSMVEQFQQPRKQEPVETAPERPRQKINWDYPEESIEKLVEERLQAKERAREQEDRQRRATEAQSNFYDGKEAAYREDKKLYEGIETEVEKAIYESYRSGILNERSLANPKTWKRAAQLLRLERGETDRLISHSPTPTRPTQTETPVGRPISTEDVSVEIDEETRRWGREQHLTDKQIEEIIGNEMKAALDGKNKTVRFGR